MTRREKTVVWGIVRARNAHDILGVQVWFREALTHPGLYRNPFVRWAAAQVAAHERSQRLQKGNE